MNEETGNQRRLRTPAPAAAERSAGRSAGLSPARSRSRLRGELERELQEARRRIQDLEHQIHRDRQPSRIKSRERDRATPTRRSRSRASRRRSRSPTSSHRRERSRSPPPNISRSRSRNDGRQKRSRTPSFSTKDVIDLVNSIKCGLTSQPVTSGNNLVQKSIDQKNILPNFDPSTKGQRIDIWLKKVNECAKVYGWDERTTVHFAMQKLQGLAKVWYEGLNTILYSWIEWQDKLRSAFPCDQNYGQTLEDMLKRKSKYTEPIETYYYEKLALLNQCDISGKRAVECIIHGIVDRTIKSSAIALCCSQPDQLLQFLMSNKEPLHVERTHFKNKSGNDFHINSQSYLRGSSSRSTKPTGVVYCFNCNERGHPYLRCTKPLIKCSKCNKIGHTIDKCNSKLDTIPEVQPRKTMCITQNSQGSKYTKKVRVNDVEVDAFIDFGSEVTLVQRSLVCHLGLFPDNYPSILKGFGNNTVQSLGSLLLDVTVDGVLAKVSCRVVDDQLLEKPILIGQSYTEQPHIVVFKTSNVLRFDQVDQEIPVPQPDIDLYRLGLVQVNHDTTIYGPATLRASLGSTGFNGCAMLQNNRVGKPNQAFIISGGVYEVLGGNLDIPVYPCVIPCTIRKGFVVSRAEKVDFVRRLVIQSPGVEECDSERSGSTVIKEEDVRLGDSVQNKDKQRLMSILHQYSHCFASNLKDLGCTAVTKLSIELKSQKPIVYRPYRLSHHERSKLQTMVGEMLDAGIVQESTSEFASPIILVRKKDGSSRLCVDYRMLNSVTIKERYPMPIIEDEISRLSGQSYFITLDLASGYYQVPIAEHCKHLTAFVTPDGLYEFNRMPFGLANAPAVFQRMINKVLGSARFTKATAYMDDVMIYGKDPSECLDRLEEILRLIEEAGLTLNLTKCVFLRSSIEYLGYEISAEGVRPGEKKIESVKNFPRPGNLHNVRQFLGLASYFRKFVRNFASIAAPLTQLLKKDCVWDWNNDREVAFQTLKTLLTERPILAIYNQDAETELHTDASKDGVGGILLQKAHEGNFMPVAYCSRRTSPEERHYHSYELETLAVVRSLEKFRVYLLGKTFKVVSDCSALRSTFLKRDLIPRIARWWLLLQEYDCSIEYRPGVKMAHVDALSRNPIDDTITNFVEKQSQVMTICDEDWLHTLQLGDSELSRIRQILDHDLGSKELQYIRDNYVIKDNKLYRYVNGDTSNLRWVVPKGARWQVCRMNHDEMGHLGLEKTLDRIKSTYWFAKMSRFVKKYVTACIDCAYAKKTATTKEGLLHPIEKVELPFHTLHIDHLGPFVRSKRGNSYILTIVDAFTKFLFVRPVRNTNTQNVIRVLDDIFYMFRVPDRLISDRGSCFTSHLFKRYCYDKGIKHILNAVASPKSNGQVERYNRTVLSSLTAQNLRCDEKEWDSQLGKIQWGCNNTVQKTTGRKPAEVMFGTHMNGETNPKLNEALRETREVADVEEIQAEVKDKIDLEQEKQKEYYDRNRYPAQVYQKGDLVKITKVNFQNDGKSKKLLPSYIGPYRVTRVLGQDRYRIASIPGFSTANSRTTTIAAERMRPWVHVAALNLEDEPGSSNESTDYYGNNNDIDSDSDQ